MGEGVAAVDRLSVPARPGLVACGLRACRVPREASTTERRTSRCACGAFSSCSGQRWERDPLEHGTNPRPPRPTLLPCARIRFFQRLGAQVLGVSFVQPSLGPGLARVPQFLLVAFAVKPVALVAAEPPAVDARIVATFVPDYFEYCERPDRGARPPARRDRGRPRAPAPTPRALRRRPAGLTGGGALRGRAHDHRCDVRRPRPSDPEQIERRNHRVREAGSGMLA